MTHDLLIALEEGGGADRAADVADAVDALRLAGFGEAGAVIGRASEVGRGPRLDFGAGHLLVVEGAAFAAPHDDAPTG